MRYSIALSREAIQDLRRLTPVQRSSVREAIETHLRHEPRKESKSRIKRLRGIQHPAYRLRVGEVRVFYDVFDDTVQVMAILWKSEAISWLQSLEGLQ
jgi:mRNA-degrading endonuclease RelE of RelBE toxin-antitoxin system